MEAKQLELFPKLKVVRKSSTSSYNCYDDIQEVFIKLLLSDGTVSYGYDRVSDLERIENAIIRAEIDALQDMEKTGFPITQEEARENYKNRSRARTYDKSR